MAEQESLLPTEKELQDAAKRDDTVMIRWLICNTVNVNAKNMVNRTALHWAVAGGNENAVKLLLEFNANVDIEDKFGMTPALLAAWFGHLKLLQILVNAGAKVTATNWIGQSLHHCAAQQGHLNIINYTMDDLEEVPLDRPDQEGNGIGHLAARQGHVHVLENLMDVIFTEARNQQNLNALHYAVRQGHQDVCRLLVEEGIDVNAVGKSASLHLAVKHNFAQIVKLLVDAGCDINIGDHRQQSALHLAVEKRQLAIVEMLLKNNINLQLQDKQGKTALDLAVRGQHAVLVDMIIKTERFNARQLGTWEVGAEGQGGSALDLTLNCVQDLNHIRAVLWILATKHLKAGDWKKLAEHWDFSNKHIIAMETQWTGKNSYKEHGYRMLQIWLHGFATSGNHPIKEMYESLVKIGNAKAAEKIRRQVNTEEDSQQRCMVM
ncbi:ankyrin repeat and death domain-containing protein 1A-like isoform X7 [Scyliorhinus torazame]|uniref:ankyrin repeat and death domain-containing protein 1A-like isoform X7 n=1 Tax=Scyliorhinus torazame TaxID=75743 RepID=UPI003B5924FE